MKNDHIDDLVQLGEVLELVTSAISARIHGLNSTFRRKVKESIEILKELSDVEAPTTVRFETKSPKQPKTWMIHVRAPVASEPQELYDALNSVGFCEAPSAPGERYFCRPGSGLFNGWSMDEKDRFLGEAIEVLQRFGFIDVKFHDLTLQECL